MKFSLINVIIILSTILLSQSMFNERRKKKKRIIKKVPLPNPPDPGAGQGLQIPPNVADPNIYPLKNLTNRSLVSDSFQKLSNETYRPLDSSEVYKYLQNWDFNLLKHELQDIFQWMLFKENGRVDQNSLRIFYELFVSQFKSCDISNNNMLSFVEYLGCIKNNTEFRYIKPAYSNYTALTPNSTTSQFFYNFLFFILDSNNDQSLNFHEYMKLNLYAFSWKYCSVFANYVTESEFECAMQIAAQLNIANGNKLKVLYNFWIDLANNQNLRFLDFSYFVMLADSVRLHSLINLKKDDDATRREVDLAMDQGILPNRYNIDIIQSLFDLVEQSGRSNSGFDLFTFVFYDYYLRMFFSFSQERPYFLSIAEFASTVSSDLFSNRTRAEMILSPTYNLTGDSYNQFAFANITTFFSDNDFFFKFSQVESKDQSVLNKVNNQKAELNNKNMKANERKKGHTKFHVKMRTMTNSKNKYIEDSFGPKLQASLIHSFENRYNITSPYISTLNNFFNLLDSKQIGYLSFYDFANFVQLGYIFENTDRQLLGTVTNDKLYDKLNSGLNFPSIGFRVSKRSYRLNEFEEDLPFDLFTFITVMKLDDLVGYYLADAQTTLIKEVDLRILLNKSNMGMLPNNLLDQCLRGLNSGQLPMYDWECAFKFGIKGNLNFYRDMNNRQNVRLNKLPMTNTALFQINPIYK